MSFPIHMFPFIKHKRHFEEYTCDFFPWNYINFELSSFRRTQTHHT